LLTGLLVPSLVLSQKRPPSQQITVRSPERTDAGDWSGTWFYQTRGEKWALWLRETDGLPEMRLQFQSQERGENFKTDWQSVAHYAKDGKTGEFRLSFDRRDANIMSGDWLWRFGTDGVDPLVREETASFRFYRAGLGRQLVLRFGDFKREYRGEETLTLTSQVAWTFHKSSRRLVRWQELPF
jgi:hypothetical protein